MRACVCLSFFSNFVQKMNRSVNSRSAANLGSVFGLEGDQQSYPARAFETKAIEFVDDHLTIPMNWLLERMTMTLLDNGNTMRLVM